MAKKRRFGKKVTQFRTALGKLKPMHRVPHVAEVMGEAMGLSPEKIAEEIGIAVALFGHLLDTKPHVAKPVTIDGKSFVGCSDAACKHSGTAHMHEVVS